MPRARNRLMSIDDVITAVDIKRFTCDEPCSVHAKEGDRYSDILYRHETSTGCLRFSLLQELIEFGNP